MQHQQLFIPQNQRIQNLDLSFEITRHLQDLHLSDADLIGLEQNLAQIRRDCPVRAAKLLRYSSWIISTGTVVALPTTAYLATDSQVFQNSSWFAVLLLLASLAIHCNCKSYEENRVNQGANDWIVARINIEQVNALANG